MSIVRSQWAYVFCQVCQLWYEQDDSFMGKSYQEAQPEIEELISKWTTQEFSDYVQQNFTKDEDDQLHRLNHCSRVAGLCL